MMFYRKVLILSFALSLVACVGEEESLFSGDSLSAENQSESGVASILYVIQNKATNGWLKPKECGLEVDESVPLVQAKANAINVKTCALFEFIPAGIDSFYIKNKVTNAYFRPRLYA